jgi:hypothetical protein
MDNNNFQRVGAVSNTAADEVTRVPEYWLISRRKQAEQKQKFRATLDNIRSANPRWQQSPTS